MKVSIKDIAKAAGVSHSTVSRALSDNPLIAEATRRRIQRIAQKMGYTPNAIARGLVTQRTHAIGVIVTTIEDPFIAEVVRGIEDVAGDHNYRVFLGTSHNDPAREVNLVKALREWRVDGVIVASSRVGALYQPLLKEIGAPIVLINNQNQQRGRYIHSISVDDTQGGELATRYLVEQGHRVIGYVSGPRDYAAERNRLDGYTRALAQAGIAFDPALVQQGNGRADGGEQVARLLPHLPALTAIFCYNDMTAIGALAALKRHSVRVPDDVSLVGYDDIPFAALVDPPLTTIHQPKDEMGRMAVRMLLDLLDGKRVENVIVPGKLVVRASTRAVVSAGMQKQAA
jgi:DNA-binding LacI/PurR family transcriptional regulator